MEAKPSLRFDGFREPWIRKSISEIGKVVTGSTPPTGDTSLYGGKYLFVSPADLTGSRSINSTHKTLTQAGHKKGRSVPSGTTLFVCIGSTIGKTAQASTECTTNQQINAVVSHEENSDDFVFDALSRISKRIKLLAGHQAVPILNKSSFEAIELAIPCQKEQQKIADFLTAVDQRIQQLKQKQSLLQQYKKGLMQQLFSQALRFKDDNGNSFPDWEEKRLADVADVVGGGTPDSGNPSLWKGEVQWFTPTELGAKYVRHSKRTITKEGLKASSAKLLPVGSLLFSSRATVGDIAISLEQCATNQGFQSLVVNRDNSNEFVYYWVLHNKKDFLRRAQGSTFLEISGGEVRKTVFSKPSLDEQIKIANALAAMDKKIDLVAQQIEYTQTFKKGLLQQMFV